MDSQAEAALTREYENTPTGAIIRKRIHSSLDARKFARARVAWSNHNGARRWRGPRSPAFQMNWVGRRQKTENKCSKDRFEGEGKHCATTRDTISSTSRKNTRSYRPPSSSQMTKITEEVGVFRRRRRMSLIMAVRSNFEDRVMA
jgi:hypothetical protein